MNHRFFSQPLLNLSLVILFLFALAACSASPETEPIYTRLTEGTLSIGSDIPLPANEEDIMLTVSGAISRPNQEDRIVMDRATIEALGEVEYTVHDPFLEQTITYRGVLLSDLLKLWGVSETATQLYVVALNDYEVAVPIEDFEQMPVIFALRANGEYMPISTRGPAMLVYPYDHVPVEIPIYNNYWAWQIKSIEVR